MHSCCGVKHIVFSNVQNLIDNPLHICIRCYSAETELKFTFMSLNMGLKGKERWMPPLKCFSLTYVVI